MVFAVIILIAVVVVLCLWFQWLHWFQWFQSFVTGKHTKGCIYKSVCIAPIISGEKVVLNFYAKYHSRPVAEVGGMNIAVQVDLMRDGICYVNVEPEDAVTTFQDAHTVHAAVISKCALQTVEFTFQKQYVSSGIAFEVRMYGLWKFMKKYPASKVGVITGVVTKTAKKFQRNFYAHYLRSRETCIFFVYTIQPQSSFRFYHGISRHSVVCAGSRVGAG